MRLKLITSFRDISLYETTSGTNIPYYYTVIGNKFRLLPTSNGTNPLRVWYNEDPLKLVKPQGRINSINITDLNNQYFVLDAAGSDLTTESDQLNSYINVIDAQSGKRKASFQVKNIQNELVYIKNSPARATVLNTPIDTTMVTADLLSNAPANQPDVSINADDFICVVKGGCVPFLKKPFSNFLIQYAVAEIRRKLGGPVDDEQQVLAKLEEQVERSWVGRENTLRVSKKNDTWALPTRRYWSSN